jgi:hypothetical protein
MMHVKDANSVHITALEESRKNCSIDLNKYAQEKEQKRLEVWSRPCPSNQQPFGIVQFNCALFALFG